MRRPSGTSAMPAATRGVRRQRLESTAGVGDARRHGRGTRPTMALSSDDLPAPLAPMIATVSACVDVEVDAEDRLEVAVAHVQADDVEDPLRCRVSHGRPRCRRRDRPSAPRRSPSPLRDRPRSASAGVDGHHAVDHAHEGVDDVLDPHDRDAARADLADRVDEGEHLGFGEPAGDLVEEQQRSAAWPALGRARDACGRATSASRRATLALCRMPARARASTAVSSPEPRSRSALPNVAPTSTFSKTLSPPNGRGIWAVRPMPIRQRACAGARVTSIPRSGRARRRGAARPATRLSNVVLPAPLGPTMPRASPSATSNDRESITWKPPKRFETSTTSRRRQRHLSAQASGSTRPSGGSPVTARCA